MGPRVARRVHDSDQREDRCCLCYLDKLKRRVNARAPRRRPVRQDMFLREVVLCNNLADERLELRWGGGELQRFTEHGFRFGEQGFVFGEEGDEGLTCFKMRAKFGMHLDAGVGADRVAGFGAACSEALNGPANLLAIHRGEIAGARGGEGFLRQWLVVNSRVGFAFKEGDVSALSLNDLEEGLKGGS
jgi:hypothetical protein